MDSALRQFNNTLADGQAKSGAAEAPRGRGFRLRKGGKQPFHRFRCYTDAIVNNTENNAQRGGLRHIHAQPNLARSEEHTSELQSLMRISYAVFCLKKKKTTPKQNNQDPPD